jgi:hypothetical protein
MNPLDAIAHSIQLAVAPVFMLTAVAAMIGAIATRLARIIDRGRTLEEKLESGDLKHETEIRRELGHLRQRGRAVNTAMFLLTLSALFIGGTIMALFLLDTVALRVSAVVPWTFMGGVICFLFALLCFLMETLLAGRALNFGRRRKRPS